jgi:hypothetical protein
MSVIRVNKSDVETFTLVTTPSRTYTSSSLTGSVGSVKVFPRLSKNEKDAESTGKFNDSKSAALVDSNFESESKSIFKSVFINRSAGSSAYSDLDKYLTLVDATNAKKTETLDVERFTPTTKFTKYTLSKNNVKDVLMRYYLSQYQHSDWAYTNYNSLNFFSAFSGTPQVQMVPTSSVLLYPNAGDADVPSQTGYVSGSYCLSGAFSFDFHINPRYQFDGIDVNEFKAGTILHLSSCYALSVITGSKKDVNGNPLGYRLLLQLSHSADYPPSLVSPGSYPDNLVFVSDDNSLIYNNWHHVVVRWGTNMINDGTGSFIVDGTKRGNFVIPSGTIMPLSFVSSKNPDVLCIGNFYEGPNNSSTTAQSLFFSPENSTRDGVKQLTAVSSEGPTNYSFNHPLKSELHDLSIKRYFVSDKEIEKSGSYGPGLKAFNKSKFAFYVPPMFVEDTPIRRSVNGKGGILQTPFFEIDGTTDDPFNVAMSFGVNGHYINLENFTKDFSTGRFPRLLELSASAIDYTTTAQEANSFLYQQGAVAKRNLTILPCDDGKFDPNFSILSAEDYQNKFSNTAGVPNYSYINLDNLVSTASLLNGGIGSNGPDEFVEDLYGASPETPGLPPGSAYSSYIDSINSSISNLADDKLFDRGVQKSAPLTIFQRTQDPSSNQVTFFNISNLYYGKKILPGSFVLRDTSLSGSHGSIMITIKDDGMGNLYRADSETEHFTQGSVGNIFYNEGVVVIKSPHLYFFGKDQYEMSFRGVNNIHIMKYEILAGPGLLNSSSNPTYTSDLRASGDVQDISPFIYISGMYLHDENMNVVAKAKFAQPIIKREEDKVLFRVAFDF